LAVIRAQSGARLKEIAGDGKRERRALSRPKRTRPPANRRPLKSSALKKRRANEQGLHAQRHGPQRKRNPGGQYLPNRSRRPSRPVPGLVFPTGAG